MTRLDWRGRTVAVSVSALAGYVDAVGFLGSGGFFVAFMSGNSTRAPGLDWRMKLVLRWQQPVL